MNQNKAKKNRNATNKPRNKGPEKQVQHEGTYQNHRFMHAAASLVGCTAQILTQNDTLYEGIFYTFNEDFHIALKLAHRVDRLEPGAIDKESVVENLIFKPQDVVDVVFKSVDMSYASKSNFTDSAISGFNGQVVEKELQPWSAPSGLEGDMLLVDLNSSSTTNGWNEEQMLKTNKEKFGVESTYDENLSNYTVQLDKKDTEEYKQMEAMAQKKANEIENSPAYRSRVEVENGDEEEAFAAVVRTDSDSHSSNNSGKYIAPNRRKNPPPPRQQQQRMNNRTYNNQQHPPTNTSHMPPPTRANHVHPPVMRADTGQQNTPSYAHPSAGPQTTPSQTYPTTYVPIMNEDKSPSEAQPKPQRTSSELPKQRVPQVTSAPSQERVTKSIAPSNTSNNNRKSPSVEHHPAQHMEAPKEVAEKPHVPNKSLEDKTASLKRFSENFHLETKEVEPTTSPSPGSGSAPATPISATPEGVPDPVKKTTSLNPEAKEFVPRAPSVPNAPSRPMTPGTPVLPQQPQQPQQMVPVAHRSNYFINIPNVSMFHNNQNYISQPGMPGAAPMQQGSTSRNMRKANSGGGGRAEVVAAATGPPLLTPHAGPMVAQPHGHPHNPPMPQQYLVQYPPQYPAILPLTMMPSARGLQGIGPSSNHPEPAGPQHLTFVTPQGHGPNQGPPNPSAPNQPPHTPANHGPQQPHPMSYPPPVCSHTGPPSTPSSVMLIPQQPFQGGPHAVTSSVATMSMHQVYLPQQASVLPSAATQMIPPS